jgi:hypothetical protein
MVRNRNAGSFVMIFGKALDMQQKAFRAVAHSLTPENL